MTHPLHPVHTGRDESDAVVFGHSETARQLCSNCGKTLQNSHPAFHCQPCDFKLCSKCDQTSGYAHHAHISHYLFLVNIVHEIWTCNGCNKSCTELKETSCYFCNICKFYLCLSCFEPKRYLLHPHDLTKTDVRNIYYGSRGGWKCDCCGGNNGPRHFLPRHCNVCKFDLCEKCCQPQRSTLHLHELYKADTELVYQRFSGGWRCDSCQSRFHPDMNKFPYHCNICEFDLCDNCMRITDSKAPRRSFYDRNALGTSRSGTGTTSRSAVGMTTSAGFPVMSPQEDFVAGNGPVRGQSDSKCIICVEKPKDATIIHGETGHVCCCHDCAKRLEQRGDPCPVCKQPIQLVIRQFVS